MATLPPGDDIEGPAQKPFPPGKQVGQVGDDDGFERGGVQDLLHVAEVSIGAEYGHGTGVARDIVQVAGRVDGGNGHSHPADPLDGQPGQDPLDGVGQVEDDLVPFFQTQPLEAGGQVPDLFQNLGIGIGSAQIDQGRFAGGLLRLLLKGSADMLKFRMHFSPQRRKGAKILFLCRKDKEFAPSGRIDELFFELFIDADTCLASRNIEVQD